MTLNDLLGDEAKDFPLLVKYLDAGDKLSVQVHPIKNEMWYIVECDEGAELVMGLSEPYDRARLLEAAESGNIERLLRRVKVKKGDCYYIPQGLVHAIGAGILIAEIQENSDITYRVYDYDRKQKDGKPRELHIPQAAEVICDYDIDTLEAVQYEKAAKEDGLLAASESFASRLIDVDGECGFAFDGRFAHILCLDGEGSVGDVPICKGGSCIVFDECDVRTLSGKMQVIVSYCR